MGLLFAAQMLRFAQHDRKTGLPENDFTPAPFQPDKIFALFNVCRYNTGQSLEQGFVSDRIWP